MSAKTAPYPSNQTDAVAVAVPQESYQAAPTPPSSVAASQQYSTTDATSRSYATASPPVHTVTHGTPAVAYGKQYIPVDSRKPVVLTYCPKCSKENVQTRTHDKSNSTTALCVVAGVFFFWPLCWLPLCIRPMKQTNHYCTACRAKVGRVKPFQ